MFAIVQIGSAQFKVSEGDTITPNRLTADKGTEMTLDKVLLYSNGEDIRIGQPFLSDVKVTANVVKDVLDEKVVAFKFRRRKRYAKTHGHRQKQTALNIKKISAK